MSPSLRHHESHDPISPNDSRVGSRKSSLNTGATGFRMIPTSHDVANNHTEENQDGQSLTFEAEPLTLTDLGHIGLKYIDDPRGGHQWFASLALSNLPTDASSRLRKLGSQSDDGTGPHSLLPLLGQWISAWYQIVSQKRRAERSKPASIPEEEDLEWLLHYVDTYLADIRDSIDEREVAHLCKAITDMCKQTSRASDINAGITILCSVMQHTVYPKEGLEDALEVLCAASIILPDPLPALSDCINLLLTGPVRTDAVTCLVNFVTAPTYKNNSYNLSYARGAIRHLRAHIDTVDETGAHILHLTSFCDALHQASKCCIYRYCTEVLFACNDLLASQQFDMLVSSDFGRFMDTIDNCIRTVLPRNGSGRSLVSLQSPDRDQVIESEKQNARYLGERNLIIKTLLSTFEGTWSLLGSNQQHRVNEFFMDHIKELNDGQASLAIMHASRQQPAPESEDWKQMMSKIIDTFIRNAKTSSSNRRCAIELCAASASHILQLPNSGFEGNKNAYLAAGHHIVDRLVGSLNNETDTSIVRKALSCLTDLTFCTNEKTSYPYAELIIRKLSWFIKNERDFDDDLRDEHTTMFSYTLQNIFVRGLHAAALPTLKAFDALIEVAGTGTKSRRCRLAALRLMVRIRCDVSGMVYLPADSDSQYIAAALCRTEESLEAFAYDSGSLHRTSASHNNTSPTLISKQSWSYPEELSLVQDWDNRSSAFVVVHNTTEKLGSEQSEIRMSDWLVKVIECLQSDTDWETYSFVIVHLGAQLFNTQLFRTSLDALVKLRQVLCDQITNSKFKDPPTSTGLKKSDTALCMFNMLTALIPYATMKSESIQKGFGDDLVRAFLSGVGGSWDGTSRGCIHALCVCSFEIPASVASLYPNIVKRMSNIMTQAHLTIHILEFLAQVARLPEVHSNFTQDEITMIFGICLQFLEKTREYNSSLATPSPRASTPARHSGLSLRRPPYRAAMLQDSALPQYASALAYDTMIFWFLSLRLDVRAKYVSWIVSRLVTKNANGDEVIDEQGQVFIDMMQRTAYSDLGETKPDPEFAKETDGPISSASWVVGLSIVTAETAGNTGITQITKRQAAGTTHAIYRQLTAPLPAHHKPIGTEIRSAEDSRYGDTSMLPPHILLQMVTTAAPTSFSDQPIPLPQEDFVSRALNVFDRIPTVDSHKLGVLYIDEGQTNEPEFLANQEGSESFEKFLGGLGYRVSLQPPLEFNPQGLQYPRDGEQTIAFRDRVTEIIYHVPTMMPNNLGEDPSCNMKKSHVGNCHVVVVFNESGIPWKMDNFSSAVTFVHVVITPVNRAVQTRSPSGSSEYYHVHVLTKEGHPNVSPAADPKVISQTMLPQFIRMFGLNASVFSHAKVADDSNDDEFPSNWRARLQAIKTLKQRAIDKNGGPLTNTTMNHTSTLPLGGGRRTPVLREDTHGADRDGTLTMQLDFGKWTS